MGICFERRIALEKKFGGDIQVKLTEADNFKKIRFLEQIFEEFDVDKNGQMDMHEFLVVLRTCGFRVSKPAAMSIMKEVDADENGIIDVDEFIEFFKKMEDLEKFRFKAEAANQASGPRGKLIAGYVFVLLMGCFGLLLLDIEGNGENATIRLLLIILVVVFFASISTVLLLPLCALTFKPEEKMADLKKHIDRSLMKKGTPKYVEETLVEAVEIPAPAPKGAKANASLAVEASRLKHPHLYATSNASAGGAAPSESSRSEGTRSVGSYRRAARSEESTNSLCSQSVASGDWTSYDARGLKRAEVDPFSALAKKVWEAPGAPDIEQGHTGLVDQVYDGPRIVDQGYARYDGYHVSQYDKARELQARALQAEEQIQVNVGGVAKNTSFTPLYTGQKKQCPSTKPGQRNQ